MSKKIDIRVPEEMLTAIDSRLEDGKHMNRCEFIREAIRHELRVDDYE